MGTNRARRRWAPVLGAVLVVAVLAGACGDDGATVAEPPPDADVTVRGGEMYFEPDTVTVPAGATTIAFVNEGSTVHDFRVEGLPIHLETGPGGVVTATRDLEPGEYRFVCTVPGHEAAGMHGTLVVD